MKKAFFYAISVFIILLGLQFFAVKKYTFKFYPSNVAPEQQATAQPCQLVPSNRLQGLLFLLGASTFALTWSYGKEASGGKKTK